MPYSIRVGGPRLITMLYLNRSWGGHTEGTPLQPFRRLMYSLFNQNS